LTMPISVLLCSPNWREPSPGPGMGGCFDIVELASLGPGRPCQEGRGEQLHAPVRLGPWEPRSGRAGRSARSQREVRVLFAARCWPMFSSSGSGPTSTARRLSLPGMRKLGIPRLPRLAPMLITHSVYSRCDIAEGHRKQVGTPTLRRLAPAWTMAARADLLPGTWINHTGETDRRSLDGSTALTSTTRGPEQARCSPGGGSTQLHVDQAALGRSSWNLRIKWSCHLGGAVRSEDRRGRL
jgi:hypothetical protein